MLVDALQRRITYLRLSVTDRCDLRCAYCMPRAMRFVPRSEVLDLDELHRLAVGFIERGVRRIRLTGGEPLVRRNLLDLVRALGKRLGSGLEELTLTTNGTMLAENAEALAAAGVRRINVSLDTLDCARFAAITGRDRLPRVLEGIAAAHAAGLAVKLNTVALRGVNERELRDLVVWAHARGYAVTMIEVMPLGEVEHARADRFLPLSQVKESLAASWTLRPSAHRTGGPARYFHVVETGGTIGFITPLSENFCEGCNRVRVTATGQLFPCLGGSEQVDLRSALRSCDPDGALDRALDAAMRIKPARHDFRIDARNPAPALARHMSVTGG